MNKTPLSIFLVNCDWRDDFSASPAQFKEKLERDRLGARDNYFFVFSWARISYDTTLGKCRSIHTKTHLDFFRPLLDLATFFSVTYCAWKHTIRSDVWLCYDFGFVPALWLAQKIYGGKIIMCLNNQPRMYSKIRHFGVIKSVYSWLVEKLFSGLVDHFFTINDTMKDYIQKLGIDEKKISVFSMNTIERDGEFIQKAQKGLIRKKYNLPEQSKILLTVARLEAEKNYPRLLELFAGLDHTYVLIALGSGSLLSQLQDQCAKLEIQDRVFFPGFVQRNEIWNYYADADVFVLLSKVEALGVVFWEAMYAQVPIVGSVADGIVETIGMHEERGKIWKEEMGAGRLQ